MKKITAIRKKITLIVIPFLLLTFVASTINAQTITSSGSGGNWSSSATWIGGVVPTGSNSVIINSTVYIDGNVACNNLTINSGAFLYNTYGYSITLSVTGSVINNGSIQNHPNGYVLSLDILGNLTNNGFWNINSTTLSGSADQSIQEGVGNVLQGPLYMSDSIGDVVLNSNIRLFGSTFDLNKSTLRTNGFKLQAVNYLIKNGSVFANDTLLIENSVIQTMKFSGDYKLDGKIFSRSGNIFNGTCTILDTLYNEYNYTNTILVNGNLVNKGAILNHPNGYVLSLDINGNIDNEGFWRPNTTNLIGTTNQTIQQTPGRRFEGFFNTNDSIGDILLGSDVMFENSTWNMNNAKLNTNGYKLMSGGYTFINGKIISNDSLIIDNSVIQTIKFSGDYKIDGKIYSRSGNIFNGTCTILDTLYNEYGYTNTILVNGNLVNKGAILNHPNGYVLSLDINGNIDNEGFWRLNTTNLTGTSDQTIQQTPGKRFEGYINTTDSIGDILLGSDVMLESSIWNMNNAKLRTNGYKLLSSSYSLTNGKVISNDSLVLNNSIIQNMKFFGDYKLDGNIFSQSGNVFNDSVTIIDTLMNQYGYTNTIQVKGSIINKGTIKNHPNGYVLSLDIMGNIRNEGTWAVNSTNLINSADQTIQQIPGKRFEGIFNTTDSIGDIVLGSNVMFEANTWNMNNSKLRTNGYKLFSNSYSLTNGKIISNDTLVLDNSIIQNMKFFGNYTLDGNIYSQSYNVFNDSVTVIDTLMNQYGYTNTILVNGDLINNGSIFNHPNGYVLNMQVKGNLTNNLVLNISNLYLIGTNQRTVGGSNANGIQAIVSVDDAIHLIGDNVLPNISFTSNPNARCTVDSAASLSLKAISGPSRIINFGKVSVAQEVDNTIPNTLSFYESSMKSNAGVLMTKLTIDHYGYQQHPTATGAVNCWWRLRNYSQNFSDSLVFLKLNYKTDALNGNPEDSLKVFFSPNAGLTWNKINAGVSVDSASNTVTINNAPSYGHYLLSSTALGITTFHPRIENIEPKFGGNTGIVTLYVFGAGLKNTSIAKLKLSGQTDIVADTSYLTDIVGESMLARFNLKNKTIGLYDVVVETPGDSTLTKPACFTIADGERSEPWVSLSGRDRFLLNRWQTFNLNYGNTANIDAVGTVLVYVVNDLPGLEVVFPDTKLTLPQGVIELGPDYTRIADSVAIYYVTDSLTGYLGIPMRVYPFYIPFIHAGSSRDARVKVKLNGTGTLKMSAWMMDPFWENIDFSAKQADPMPVEVRACITAAAMKYYSTGVIGLIPGAGCYNLFDKIVDPVGHLTSESIQPEEAENTWGSWLWNKVSWASSITQCATSFMPGLGQAVGFGIGMAGMVIDMKDNSDAAEGCWRKFRKKSESKKDSRGVNSFDPNEIVGPHGFTTDNYISGQGNKSYRIYFENKDTATASALEVFVYDTLDITKFDLNTFSFNSITFGDTTVQIQDYAKEFQVLVDMYPAKNIIVQVHGVIDTLNGAISWDFHSLDRITMELTEDPDLGFLPPNVNYPEGEGNVAFSCKLKETVVHDDIITNKASVIFDFNAPLITNTASNKIDAIVPVSSVASLNSTQPSNNFTVNWSGTDQGCGILNYSIFVSDNDSAFVVWKAFTNSTTDVFNGIGGHSYKFFCIASDSIGLTEAQKLSPEASTTVLVGINDQNKPDSQFKLYPNPASDFVTFSIDNINNAEMTLSIYSVLGELIRTETLLPNQKQINVKDLCKGIYLVEIKSSDWLAKQKLIIQK